MNKFFIITVDTEGDNLWAWHKGDPIGTKNTKYIPRFQKLCNKYDFKPVYLTNYEMLMDDEYCVMVKEWQAKGQCEVALHLHAWNNPPLYKLDAKYSGNPYLIEYPDDVMKAKFKVIYDLFVEKIGCKPFSHRSGRWAMDERYFNILNEFGVKVDCSYTPGIDWSHNMGETIGGSNYSNVPKLPFVINGVSEIPVTIRSVHHALKGGWKHRIKTIIKGENLQLRPATNNLAQMKKLVNVVEQETDTNYLEFMLHSSELMPGGSPYFEDEAAIEREYCIMDQFFLYAYNKGYRGTTLKEYYQQQSYESIKD